MVITTPVRPVKEEGIIKKGGGENGKSGRGTAKTLLIKESIILYRNILHPQTVSVSFSSDCLHFDLMTI